MPPERKMPTRRSLRVARRAAVEGGEDTAVATGGGKGKKRKRIAVDATPDLSASLETSREAEEETQCAVCFTSFTATGGHRVAALKCGHLFGKACIEQWIRQEGDGRAKCPLCKQVCRLNEVVPLFVKSVKVVDCAELDELRATNGRLSEENRVLNVANEDLDHRCKQKDTRITQMEANHRVEMWHKDTEIAQLKTQLGEKTPPGGETGGGGPNSHIRRLL